MCNCNENLKVKIINKSKNPLPNYATENSAGMDLRANLSDTVTLNPGERKLIPTGLYIQLPSGYEAQIRPRSGLAINQGITVLNSPGTIDADYRGEIKVIICNFSDASYFITNGDKIAQMVITKVPRVEFCEVESLEETERGTKGFGHTGIKGN